VTFPSAPPPTFTTGWPGLPTPGKAKPVDAPRTGRYAFKAAARRKARLRRAAEALGQLPQEGEAVHFLIESYFDPCDLIEVAARAHPAPCEVLRTATLSFSARNVRQLCDLIDGELVHKLTLLSSDWMKDANAKVYTLAREELAERRRATVAAARAHAKVSCLHFADGARLVFEGSGNLSSCRTIEQVACIRDVGLHDWHAQWIDSKVLPHESDQGRCEATG
jgi:hypothetical protein